jgi:Rha family phage regulatory protein
MTSTQMTPIDPQRNPIVFTKDGEVFANSRDVALFFGKQHGHVMRDIDNLIASEPKLGLSTFGQTQYVEDQNGQAYRSYDMDRDGFTLLCMGFTGGKALKWKLRYIEAFNAMEAELRRIATSGPTIDLNDPGALRGLLLTYSEKAMELERQVKELLPSQEALNRLSQAEGSLCVTDAAKALQMRPSDLFKWLRQNGWTYRRVGAAHDLGYSSKTNSGLLEHKVTTVLRTDGSEKVTEQVRVTARGLTTLARLVKPAATLI